MEWVVASLAVAAGCYLVWRRYPEWVLWVAITLLWPLLYLLPDPDREWRERQ